ncbi:hypothetical protein ACXWRS_11360, partial [Streptococcus pyogenes]
LLQKNNHPGDRKLKFPSPLFPSPAPLFPPPSLPFFFSFPPFPLFSFLSLLSPSFFPFSSFPSSPLSLSLLLLSFSFSSPLP